MNTLHSLELNNVVYIKEATLQLDYEGITWITGKNLNANLKGRNNGAGKSLLVSPLAQLMANSLPTQEKGQRSSKNAFYANGTSTVLTQTVKGVTYQATKSFAKNKASWKVAKKVGDRFVDMEFATPSKAEAFALGLCALSNEEIFSTVYIDSRKSFVMVTGTPSERFNYMSNLFRLEEYDRVRELAKADLDAVNKQEVELTLLREQYEGQVVNPKSLKLWESKALKARLKADLDREAAVTSEDHAEALSVYLKYKDDVELLYVDIKDLKRQWAKHTRARKAYDQYADAQTSLRKVKRKLDKLERTESNFMLELKASCNRVAVPFAHTDDVSKVIAKLVANLDKLDGQHRDLNESIDNMDRERLEVEEIFTAIQDCDKALRLARRKLKGKPSAKEVYGELRVTEHRISELRKHLDGHDTGKCSLCGHAFSSAKAKRELRTLERNLAKLDSINRLHDAYIKLENERTKLYSGTVKQLDKELDELVTEQVKSQAVRNTVEDQLDAAGWDSFREAADEFSEQAHEWTALQKDLTTLKREVKSLRRVPKVAKPETDRKLKDKLLRAAAVHAHKEEIEKGMSLVGSTDHLATIIRRLKREARKFHRSAAKQHMLAGEAQNKVTEGQRTIRQLGKVKHRIRELRDAVKFKRSYEAVYDAYGKNGVKLNHVQALCKQISANLNKYSHLLFPEKFRFELMAGQNSFDVLVTRPTERGEAPRISDALHLSGSEGRSFQLLWLISILPLLPADRRYNVVILDEMEATMDEPSRELMIRDFLPVLNEIIPHIVFISPNSDNTPGHRYRHLEVVKKGKTSTVHLIQEVA